MNKSRLHATAVYDRGTWHSLPPHVPGACYGRDGDPCPETPPEPCRHNHQSSRAALACSRSRPVFQAGETEKRYPS